VTLRRMIEDGLNGRLQLLLRMFLSFVKPSLFDDIFLVGSLPVSVRPNKRRI